MRNGLPIVVFMLFVLAQLNAQKVDIDKKSISTTLISLPSKDLDTSLHTFSFLFNGNRIPANWGMDLEALQNAYFKLEGYNLVEKDGDLQLECTLHPVKFLDSNVQSRVEKSKDKAGRETSKSYYKHVLSYESGFDWKMKDKAGTELSNKLLGFDNVSIKKHEGKEFGTYKEASDSYNNNRVQVNRDIAKQEIESYLSMMALSMNKQFGYRALTEKFSLWVLDSKNHPEYDNMRTHFETAKAAFAAMGASGLSDADWAALKPVIDYYLSIPEKYRSAEKPEVKLRYAAYFNLTNIYLFTDQLDKASTYANLIISNDYDKGDGKDFLKNIEKLKEMFVKKNVGARRFQRL